MKKETFVFNKYINMHDEDVIDLIKSGDTDAQEYIFGKYKNVVKMKSRAYFLIGADSEDIIQEGMIGLYKAIRDFQKDKNASFKVFAELCINRQIITAIKTATRQKHMPLNSYVSLNKSAFNDDSEETYMDILKTVDEMNPEALLIGQENKDYIESNIGKILSDFERKVLGYYLQGKSYFEISKISGKPEKSVDNALQRVKKKIEKFMEEKELDT
ncbi:RNA polymerase factor sigma-70 [Tyzzerella sp. An114]|uniref:RNA polymerase sporulation sigma factor SigH n=1 Tax=Tyzzerella sp. An114 TaxID=1965545 RepID=UPI000B438EA0|nr:RNA polymerase sporulation sigma factor SigH [Tyzzerella sp. An114]OUQ57192.1 RNA polymerase factor sigma-70 [Tyzzerella sp. An114]HIT73646.1 RNA polymerase sporulation sigma factor SigH [Candidatus Fimicola cottocaccae]